MAKLFTVFVFLQLTSFTIGYFAPFLCAPVGFGNEGDFCQFSLDCSDTLDCIQGVCTLIQLGSPCKNDSDCGRTFRCLDGCDILRETGDVCDTDLQCKSRRCNTTCVGILEGKSCANSTTACEKGLWCDPQQFICKAGLNEGQLCTNEALRIRNNYEEGTLAFSRNSQFVCKNSLCDFQTNGNNTATCTALFSKQQGDPCGVFGIFTCDEGTFCNVTSGSCESGFFGNSSANSVVSPHWIPCSFVDNNCGALLDCTCKNRESVAGVNSSHGTGTCQKVTCTQELKELYDCLLIHECGLVKYPDILRYFYQDKQTCASPCKPQFVNLTCCQVVQEQNFFIPNVTNVTCSGVIHTLGFGTFFSPVFGLNLPDLIVTDLVATAIAYVFEHLFGPKQVAIATLNYGDNSFIHPQRPFFNHGESNFILPLEIKSLNGSAWGAVNNGFLVGASGLIAFEIANRNQTLVIMWDIPATIDVLASRGYNVRVYDGITIVGDSQFDELQSTKIQANNVWQVGIAHPSWRFQASMADSDISQLEIHLYDCFSSFPIPQDLPPCHTG